MIKEYKEYKVSETVLPIYINGQCPIIKTCSDVTLNLSSKDSINGLKRPNTDKISKRDRLGYVILHYEAIISKP